MLENKIQDLIEALNRNTDAILATLGKPQAIPELKLIETVVKNAEEEVKVDQVEEKPEANPITPADIRGLAVKLLDMGKRKEIEKINEQFGIARLSEATPEKFQELYDKLLEVVAKYEKPRKD